MDSSPRSAESQAHRKHSVPIKCSKERGALGKAFYQEAVQKLRSHPTATLDARLLLQYVFKIKEENFQRSLGEEKLDRRRLRRFWRLVERRKRGVPIAYLTGEKEFFGRPFYVSPAVLVPRPETERLVEQTLKLIPKNANWTVADVGAGSGVIGITLALERPQLKVYLTDRSRRALRVAQKNVRRYYLTKRISVRAGKLLAALPSTPLQIIVANLPYLSEGDRKKTPPDLTFEPSGALYAGKDGLDVIRSLIRRAPAYLFDGGFLALEIDPRQERALRELINSSFYYPPKFFKDYSSRTRVLMLCRR